MKALRIAVADDEADMLQYYRETLSLLGHEVVVAAENGRQLVEECLAAQPELVITDIKMPEMDGIEAAGKLSQSMAVPVILVSAFYDAELIERATRDHVVAYLVKPIKRADLETTIALATQRFREFNALWKEAASLRQALDDRKIIERAKGILMKRAELDEASAFRRLQKQASDRNMKLAEMAKAIVMADEAFGAD